MNIRDGIYGGAVGDAFGVPYEFLARNVVEEKIQGHMIGNGSHNQDKGTWSDDTSMTLCLLDNLEEEINYKAIMESFVQWYKKGIYTANGVCFDIGRGTKNALKRYINGITPIKCGSKRINNNGNGSLMRCVPIIYYMYYWKKGIQRDIIHNLSSLTHGNEIALIACDVYVSLGYKLLCGEGKLSAYMQAVEENIKYWGSDEIPEIKELTNIPNLKYSKLSGSGYVISTLQSAIWCVINSESYEECIYKCVKIGGDTDTIASIAGGLAGIIYGKDSIPTDWIKELKNKELIESVCKNWEDKFVVVK